MRLPRPVLSGRLAKSPLALATGWFAIFYIIAVLYVRHISWRDPGSWFFDPAPAYEPRYSSVRLEQAERFLANASSTAFQRLGKNRQKEPPQLCVGVVSIVRVGARYLRTAIASLLEGLTEEERDSIHLIVFIPHIDPSIHPAYQDPWLFNLVDKLLLYNLTGKALDRVKDLEEKKHARAKIMLDYQYLMKECHASGVPYIALLEDDTLAMDGWFHRTMQGLAVAEEKAIFESTMREERDFLYMRLFYTEEYLGWDIEDAPIHALWCILVILTIATVLMAVRSRFTYLRDPLSNLTIAAVCCIWAPLLIFLYFSAGKITTQPLPSGINAMNNYGCCAQGLVWPRNKAEELMHWYDTRHPYGFSDMLIEDYANRRGEMRYALTPSVIQHIGSHSSRGDDWGPAAKHNRNVAQKLWNFQFEMFDAEALRKEHERVVEDGWPT